jgi:hypothetical protein
VVGVESFRVFIYSSTGFWQDGTWFYYMTNWQTSLFALYSFFALLTVILIRRYHSEALYEDQETSAEVIGADDPAPYYIPFYVRFTWILHGFAMSVGLWVTLLFWTGVVSTIADDIDPTYTIDHGSTMFLMVLDFSLAAFPWLLLQFVWSVLFGVI